MAETRKLQYGIRLPDGTVYNIVEVPRGYERSRAHSAEDQIRATIAEAKNTFGVGDDYQPELVHRFIVTKDWVTGEFDPEPDTE